MHPAFDPRYDSVLDDLRQGTRFLKDPEVDTAVVWQTPGEALLVGVHDESLSGLCLVMPCDRAFAVGSKATIVYNHEVLEATVRHVTPQAESAALVGFECHTWVNDPNREL